MNDGSIYLPEVLERLDCHARLGNVEAVERLTEKVKQHAKFRAAVNRMNCSNHDPNTGPGSDWCPNCRQYEPAVPA